MEWTFHWVYFQNLGDGVKEYLKSLADIWPFFIDIYLMKELQKCKGTWYFTMDFCGKGHSFCKQCLYHVQFMKTRSSSQNLSKLARDDISCQFMETKSLCRSVYKMNRLYMMKENKLFGFPFHFAMHLLTSRANCYQIKYWSVKKFLSLLARGRGGGGHFYTLVLVGSDFDSWILFKIPNYFRREYLYQSGYFDTLLSSLSYKSFPWRL